MIFFTFAFTQCKRAYIRLMFSSAQGRPLFTGFSLKAKVSSLLDRFIENPIESSHEAVIEIKEKKFTFTFSFAQCK